MKKAIGKLFLLLLIVIEIFSACSTGGGGPDWDENILVYATLNPDRVDQEAVDEFNRNHADIQIEVRSYYDEEDPSGKNGRERLITEIMAGKIPDILDISYDSQLPYQQLAQKGYLEDLWPWIENDPDLGRESLMEPPLKAAEVNGKLYMAFPSVIIHTLVGAESVVGSRNSWTLDDLWSAFAQMPEGSTITDYNAGQDLMFDMICRMKLDSYVDWERGQCFFDSEDFRTTLEFVNSFQADTDQVADESTGTVNMEILDELRRRRQNGLQMLSMVSVSSMDSIQIDDLQFKGRSAYVGYPVEDGSVGSAFTPQNPCLAISAVCRNKEAAWDFLRQVFLPQYDLESAWNRLSGMASGFPVNRADYELLRRMRMNNESKYTVHIGDTSLRLPKLTKDEVQRFEDFYNQIEKIDLCDSNIYDIVWEQAQPYFAGDKTLDETVDLIQRRVTLYVNEAR